MDEIRQFVAFLVLAFLFMTASITRAFGAERPPNVVFIFADDLGYNDLGCYGAPLIRTPNLDTMASEGVRFTDFYSCACVCTPSRAGLLTGRYPGRSGLDYHVLFPYSTNGIPADEITLGEAFQDLGYATACVGKWHLGHLEQYLPTNNGFDYYYGIPYSNDMTPCHVLEGTEVVEAAPADQTTLTKRYTQKALEFIDASHAAGERFFLYFPHTFPHVPLYASEDFLGTSPRGLYGDVVEEIDWSVGEIRAKLEALGIARETLVIFTSDNGPWLTMGADGGSADPLRDGKGTIYDGGIREPCIAWWPGSVPAGREEARPAIMVDWFPTLVRLCGGTLPTDRTYDGRDISGLLFGTGDRADHELFFNSTYQGVKALRSGDWKLWAQGTPALYDLAADISEATDLSGSQTATFDRLQAELDAFVAALGREGAPGDIDGDGIPDFRELLAGLDPCYTVDGVTDRDGDGFTSYEEYLAGSDPTDAASLPGPVNLTATAVAADSIALAWEASPVQGIVSYNVHRSTEYNFTPSTANRVASGLAATAWTDSGLEADTTYFYAVAGADGTGAETAPSRKASATTEIAPPATPSGLSAVTLSAGSIALDWGPGTDADLAGYNVYRDTSTGFTPDAAHLVVGGLASSGHTDSGLASSTAYYYRVTAVDVNGNESAPSAEASATTAAVGTGPVARWMLDEFKGPTAFDSSGNGNDGTLGPTELSGPSWVQGRLGGALEFDGQSACVETTWQGIGGSAARTVAFWIRTTDKTEHGLVSWGESSVSGAKWHLRVNSDGANGTAGAIRTEVQGGYIIGSVDIADGNWHHVASVFPEDGTPDVEDVIHYVDGVADAASGTDPQAVNTSASGRPVNLGRRDQSGWKCFAGGLDDVRIYDSALDQAEVQALFDAGLGMTPPTATDDSAETDVSVAVAVDVLANDTDAGGGTLAVIDATQPSHGSVRVNADGTLTYTPQPGFTGLDCFSYVISDGQGSLDAAAVRVTVKSASAPVASADSYSMATNGVLTIAEPGVLAGDTDADGDPIVAKLVDATEQGTLELEADGSFTYSPYRDFEGTDSFTYGASDGLLESAPTAVTIEVVRPRSAAGGCASGSAACAMALAILGAAMAGVLAGRGREGNAQGD